MKKVLADPIAPRQKKDGKWPWSYKAPTKDQAHSGYLSAGNDYGVGFRTPVGKEKASDIKSGPIPQESHCFSPNEIFDHEDRRG
jgi:hypothetical protein